MILGSSTTLLLSLIGDAYSRLLQPGDEVVVQLACHEANIGPWVRAAGEGRQQLQPPMKGLMFRVGFGWLVNRRLLQPDDEVVVQLACHEANIGRGCALQARAGSSCSRPRRGRHCSNMTPPLRLARSDTVHIIYEQHHMHWLQGTYSMCIVQ